MTKSAEFHLNIEFLSWLNYVILTVSSSIFEIEILSESVTTPLSHKKKL